MASLVQNTIGRKKDSRVATNKLMIKRLGWANVEKANMK